MTTRTDSPPFPLRLTPALSPATTPKPSRAERLTASNTDRIGRLNVMYHRLRDLHDELGAMHPALAENAAHLTFADRPEEHHAWVRLSCQMEEVHEAVSDLMHAESQRVAAAMKAA